MLRVLTELHPIANGIGNRSGTATTRLTMPHPTHLRSFWRGSPPGMCAVPVLEALGAKVRAHGHAWPHVGGTRCLVSNLPTALRRLYVHRVYWSRKGEALPLTLYTAASMSRLKVGLWAGAGLSSLLQRSSALDAAPCSPPRWSPRHTGTQCCTPHNKRQATADPAHSCGWQAACTTGQHRDAAGTVARPTQGPCARSCQAARNSRNTRAPQDSSRTRLSSPPYGRRVVDWPVCRAISRT